MIYSLLPVILPPVNHIGRERKKCAYYIFPVVGKIPGYLTLTLIAENICYFFILSLKWFTCLTHYTA